MNTLSVGQEGRDLSLASRSKGDSYFFGSVGRGDAAPSQVISSHSLASSFGCYDVSRLLSNTKSSLFGSSIARCFDDLVSHSAFALIDSYRRPSIESPSVKVSADKDALAVYAQYLGEHCADRLSVFLSLKENWDGDGAEELSYLSLVQSLKFIKMVGLPESVVESASVFMDCDGCISIGLPINDEDMLEVFFLHNEVSVYSDVDDEEALFEEVGERLLTHVLKHF